LPGSADGRPRQCLVVRGATPNAACAEKRAKTNEPVESLMPRRLERRFAFIQERAKTVAEVDG